jgi:ammonia channel protein AmtB
VHTFLAGAGGGFSTLVAGLPALNLNKSALSQHSERSDMVCCSTVRLISTGVMAGLVAVSAGAGTYTPYAAAIIGAAGGFLASLLEMGTIFVPPRFPKVTLRGLEIVG